MVSSTMFEDKLMHLFLAFSFLCLLSNAKPVIVVKENLMAGDMLNSSTLLCSTRWTFCMSFVDSPEDSGLSYLVISKENTIWVTWTANSNEPARNFSGVLTLDLSGTLKILRQDQDPIILYSSPQSTNLNTMATLFDNGNFVLQELYPNGSMKSLLWQSFDYPTDTLVPGMKLGFNHKTGHNWTLMSTVINGSPASGAFTLEWEPTSAQLIIRRQGQIIWASGTVRNNKFEYISEQVQEMYNYTIVSNEDEDSFTYTTLDNKSIEWALHDNGQLLDGKGNIIASADNCYGYNTDEGCQRWDVPSCRHDQVFNTFKGHFNGKYNVTFDTNTSSTISVCKAACWSDCVCFGFFSYFDNNDTGCIFYHGDSWEFINDGGGSSFHVIVTKSSKYKGMKKWIWISAVMVTFLFIFVIGVICLIRRRRGATNGFSSSNKLGEGRFGTVYKGKLQLEKEVAINKLLSSRQMAWELWTDGEGLKLMDSAVHDSFDQNQALRCIHVAFLCLEEQAVNRPNMSEILSMLTNEGALIRLPQKPALFSFRRRDDIEEAESPAY
ncbi:hypothetical protein L6164_022848 [Bauhinia variegata]|uniref:Uncharacterized protein n=1 Tax=Bauhinia variegata TaxID=167791 RepID=A0ACB9MJT4_BAUVA|nr:hypothetical protein L6164_022848 [Bauhinia variegata]